MSKLHTMEKVVLQVLEQSILARMDDYVLMYLVCEKINPDVCDMPFGMALCHHREYCIPNWKTIERCRRKIQRMRPDLVSNDTARKRYYEEKVYKEYARE